MLDDDGWVDMPDFGTDKDYRKLADKIHEHIINMNKRLKPEMAHRIKNFYAGYGWYEHDTFQETDSMGHSWLWRVVDEDEKGVLR